MKKTFRIILSILMLTACTFTFFSCNKAPVVWETNLDAAMKTAQEQNKGLLMFFSGNEWETSSSKLMADFLSKKEFMKAAGKEFVLFTIDVPADVSTMTDEEYQTLTILTGTCQVNTCPSLIIMDVDGSPFYELTYQEGVTTLDDLISDVNAAAEVKKAIQRLEGELQNVTGAKRVQVIDELVSSVPDAYIGRYYELMASVPIIDPDNESGLVSKYTLVSAEQRATRLLYQGDFFGAVDAFAQAADSKYLSVDQKQECLYYAAYFAAQVEEWEYAIDYMERCYILDPDSDNGKTIAELLPQIRASLANAQMEAALEEE